MPRDSGGTYTLPAGNPVVTNTPIAIAWANGTLTDLGTAMTDSLSRSGDGAMTAALELFAGVIGTPGLSFSAETSLGLYRSSAGVMTAVAGGAAIAAFSSTGVAVTGTVVPTGVFSAPVGSAALPSHTFTGDLDTGMSAATPNVLLLSVGGVGQLTVLSSRVNVPAGSSGAPGLTMTGVSTGFMSSGSTNISVCLNSTAGAGEPVIGFNTGSIPIRMCNNNTGTDSVRLSFMSPALATERGYIGYLTSSSDLMTIRSIVGTLDIRDSANVARLLLDGSTLQIAGATFSSAGATMLSGDATTPAINFTGDTNTGIFRASADNISFSEGGAGFAIGYRIIPQVVDIDAYTLVITDSGKHIYRGSGNAATWTIPANAAVAFTIGTAVTFVNDDADTNITIAITTDTMLLAGTATTGSRTLIPGGIATALKVTATRWIISGTGLS